MLNHLNASGDFKGRVVVLGSAGFVGASLVTQLQNDGVDVLPLGRTDIDLEVTASAEKLASRLNSSDTLVVISAKAPVKNATMLSANVKMAETVALAIEQQSVSHMVYVSSDAVYADFDGPLDESSKAEPASLHGVMHLAREVVFSNLNDIPLGIIRPTLIYGANDPHNGYGPNRFRRLVNENADITLFGEGEERRDHVYVNDVANLILRMIKHKSIGILNAATGRVISFREAAEIINGISKNDVSITGTPRVGEMPHNGYRPFDPSNTKKAFPDFEYSTFEEAISEAVDR